MWEADTAYNLPYSNIQGAARYDGRWYLSQSNGPDNNGTLYTTAKTSSSTGTLQVQAAQPLPIGPEDLSHWPSGTSLGTMWTVAEHPGKRMVYAVIPKPIAP